VKLAVWLLQEKRNRKSRT